MDLDVIRRLLIEAKTTGIDQAASQLKVLSGAYEGVSGVSQKTEGATLSVTRSLQGLESRLDPVARVTRQLSRDTDVLAKALQQGAVSSARHSELLTAATASAVRMAEGTAQSSASQKLWAEATAAASTQAQMFASQAGPLGYALSSIGTGGLIAAAGAGVAVLAFKSLDEQAHAVGQKAIELKKFTETTGLSAAAVQALRQEGAKLGITSDEIESKLQKFSVSFEELRLGSGEALKVLQRYRPELAAQMQSTDDMATAIALLSQSFDGLSISAQNAIGRAFGGKNSADFVRLLKGTDLAASTDAFAASGRGLSGQQVEMLSKLEAENQHLRKIVSEGFAKLFAPDVLALENDFLRGLVFIGGELKKLGSSDAGADEGRLALLLEREKELTAQLETRRKFTESLTVTTQRLRDTEEEIQRIRARQDSRANPDASATAAKPQTVGPTIEATIARQKELTSVLGALASVEDQVALKENELAVARRTAIGVTDAQTASLVALARVQAELAQVAPGTYERQLAALNELKAAYPGLTAAQAQVKQGLDQQLDLARAITGVQKLQVQETINYSAEIAKGATAAEASAIAQQKTAIEVAKLNAAAQQQLISLELQAPAASAVFGIDKMRAESNATVITLLQQGVDLYIAQAVGAQQLANAQAQVNASVAQQTISLQQQTALASVRGTADEASVAANIARTNALRQGASEANANALAMATVASYEQKANEAASKRLDIYDQMLSKANLLSDISFAPDPSSTTKSIGTAMSPFEYQKYLQRQAAEQRYGKGGFTETDLFGNDSHTPNTTELKITPTEQGYKHIIDELIKSGQRGTERYSKAVADYQKFHADEAAKQKVYDDILNGPQYDFKQLTNQTLMQGGGLQDAIHKLQGLGGLQPGTEAEASRTSAVIDLLRRLNDQNHAAALPEIQKEIALLRQQPHTLETDDAIKALNELTQATKDSTKTLSGLYSRQFGQGFYDGGAGVGELIYGLDNGTKVTERGLTDLQKATNDNAKVANDNVKATNDLSRYLSENQITSTDRARSATLGVQSAAVRGFTDVVTAVNALRGGITPAPRPTNTTATSPNIQTGFVFSRPMPNTGQPVFGYSEGGEFTVPGYPAMGDNVIPIFRATAGERVTITPANRVGGNGGGSNSNRKVEVHIYNTYNVAGNTTDEFRRATSQHAEEQAAAMAYALKRA